MRTQERLKKKKNQEEKASHRGQWYLFLFYDGSTNTSDSFILFIYFGHGLNCVTGAAAMYLFQPLKRWDCMSGPTFLWSSWDLRPEPLSEDSSLPRREAEVSQKRSAWRELPSNANSS